LARNSRGWWTRRKSFCGNNHQQFVRAALADELGSPAYDTPGCVRVQAVESGAWPMLVELWASYNRYLVHVIRHLPDAKLEVVCRMGPNAPVSLGYLVEDYVRHLAHHLDQVGVAAGS